MAARKSTTKGKAKPRPKAPPKDPTALDVGRMKVGVQRMMTTGRPGSMGMGSATLVPPKRRGK